MEASLYNNKLSSIQIFCKAAELQSFSACASALGLTPAAVSRSIARLEERLGVRLFARSTRKIRLTDEGNLYFEECVHVLRQLEDAERLITGSLGKPSGLLRISMPTTYGHCRAMPVIQQYRELYPAVDVEINIANTNVDFIKEGYDLAIRMGTPKDSRLVARKLEDAQLGIYASAEYLKTWGTPKKISDISKHQCIQFIMPASGKPLPFTLYEKGKEAQVEPQRRTLFTGDVLGCITYAATGGGLVQTYDFIARQKQYSHLVEVLKTFRGASRPFSLLYPQQKMMPAKTRAFIDLMVKECRSHTGKQ